MCREERKESLKKNLSEKLDCLILESSCSFFFPFSSLKFTELYGSSHSCQITSIALKKVAYFSAFTSPGIASHSLRLGNHQPLCGCQ